MSGPIRPLEAAPFIRTALNELAFAYSQDSWAISSFAGD
jgi:hypothetical protein